MKFMIAAILGTLCFLKSMSQSSTTTVIYDGQGNVIGGSFIKIPQGKPMSLTDSVSGNVYSLDSSHIMITALDKTGKILWKTDPWKDNKIEVYRTNRPVIVDFNIQNTYRDFGAVPKGTKVLWIVYLNTQFGFLDLATGKFSWLGQD
jgi:hypothetical protein